MASQARKYQQPSIESLNDILGMSVSIGEDGSYTLSKQTVKKPKAGGGGGGGANPASQGGGNGGSGVVIIRYPDTYAAATSTTGSPTYTVTGGYRYYTFTGTGTITF